MLKPRPKLFPAPSVHGDDPSPPALARSDQNRPLSELEIHLAERQGLGDAEPSPPEDDDQPSHPQAVRSLSCLTHDGDDLFNAGRVGREPPALRSQGIDETAATWLRP